MFPQGLFSFYKTHPVFASLHSNRTDLSNRLDTAEAIEHKRVIMVDHNILMCK